MEVVLKQAGEFFETTRTLASLRSESSGASTSFEPFDPTSSTYDPRASSTQDPLSAPLMGGNGTGATRGGRYAAPTLGFAVGLVPLQRLSMFERVLFRATRGNLLFRAKELPMQLRDPSSRELLDKAVFVVFFSGERAKAKVGKICDAFNATRYPFPENDVQRREAFVGVSDRINELYSVVAAAVSQRRSMLQNVALGLPEWTTLVRREKAIYHTMNKCRLSLTHQALVAEAWCPKSEKPRVLRAVEETSAYGAVNTVFQTLPTQEIPPTYFKTNKWTASFQNIVDVYGIARYREVNPAVFTIITFPFLFAVMFGDLAHGLLLLVFALYMVWNEVAMAKGELGEMVEMCFSGRYVILLMAIFSVFTGIMYNEAFSLPMIIFGYSKYACADPLTYPHGIPTCETASSIGLVRAPGTSGYPAGIDPVWHGTRSELSFLNSTKMKMSIVMGVAHMTLGIVMSLFNHLYFNDWISIYFGFIPEMIFLHAMFGWLAFLILAKWFTGSHIDLYATLINWFLKIGSEPEHAIFAGQGIVQMLLLIVMVICLPVMLLPKPFILKARHEARAIGGRSSAMYETLDNLSSGSDMEAMADAGAALDEARVSAGSGGGVGAPAGSPGGGHGDDGGEEFDFSEVFVHQMIHTIEFALGAVSNTASYLRLWALSLAHSQLSAVFYDRVLMLGFQMNSAMVAVIGTFVWWAATAAVLMGMETLSAFLHALRLHWVEFQNKFYRGDGYKFVPFELSFTDKKD